MIECWFISD